jgi:hypothetical protein
MKTSNFKNTIVLSVALVSTLASSFTYAGCGFYGDEGRGSPHSDGSGGGTQYRVQQQAGNTWQDWIWRGKSEDEVAFCPWQATESCKYNWGRSKTVGKSQTQGFSLTVTGDIGKANSHFAHANGTAGYERSWTKYSENTINFNYEVSHARGTFIEPIIIQQRRWRRGDMKGGWVQTSQREDRGRTWTCYKWDGNRVYGRWTDNIAVGSAYRSFNIHR